MKTEKIKLGEFEERNVYTFTENQFEELIAEAERVGISSIKGYIIYCYNDHFKNGKTVSNVVDFVVNLCKFITNETDMMPNDNMWSFSDYILERIENE